MTARVGLDFDLAHFPDLAQVAIHALKAKGVSLSLHMAAEKAERALKHFGRARVAVARQRGGGDPRLCGPAIVDQLRPGAVDPALVDPRGEIADDADRVHRLLLIQFQQAGRCISCAKRTDDPRRMQPLAMEGGRRDDTDAAHQLAGTRNRDQYFSPVSVVLLGKRQRGGHDCAVDMNQGLSVRIVVRERRGERPVDKCCARHRGLVAEAEQLGLSGPADFATGQAQRLAVLQARRRGGDCDRVENGTLSFMDDVGWKVVELQSPEPLRCNGAEAAHARLPLVC